MSEVVNVTRANRLTTADLSIDPADVGLHNDLRSVSFRAGGGGGNTPRTSASPRTGYGLHTGVPGR